MEVLIEHGTQKRGFEDFDNRGNMSNYKIFTIDNDVYTEINKQAQEALLRFSETSSVKIQNPTSGFYHKTRNIWNLDNRKMYLLKVFCIETTNYFKSLIKHEIHVLISTGFDPLIVEKENLFLFKGCGTVVGDFDFWFSVRRIKNKNINNDGLIF